MVTLSITHNHEFPSDQQANTVRAHFKLFKSRQTYAQPSDIARVFGWMDFKKIGPN